MYASSVNLCFRLGQFTTKGHTKAAYMYTNMTINTNFTTRNSRY